MDFSFLQVMTIGLIKRYSSQFSSFLISPSSFNLLSSVLTESSKCRGTRLPFSWIGFRGSWKWVIFFWFLIFPIRRNKFLNVFDMFRIPLSLSVWEMEFIDLHCLLVWKCGKYFCEPSIPTFGRLSFPKIFLSCPSVKKKWQSLSDQPF